MNENSQKNFNFIYFCSNKKMIFKELFHLMHMNISNHIFFLLAVNDLLVIDYFVLFVGLIFEHPGRRVFFGSTVDDFPSMTLITFPSVEGFTKIGLGSSHSSLC